MKLINVIPMGFLLTAFVTTKAFCGSVTEIDTVCTAIETVILNSETKDPEKRAKKMNKFRAYKTIVKKVAILIENSSNKVTVDNQKQ